MAENIEEYAVVDSFEVRLRQLGFGLAFAWDIIAHIRGQTRLDKIKTYDDDIGDYNYVVGVLGLLSNSGDIFYYDTTVGHLYLYGYKIKAWKKLKVWKTSKYYCLQILEQ